MSTSYTSSRRPRVLRLEIEDLLNESLRLSFPDLREIADFITVKGDAFEMYGDDYQCPSVLHVCEKLRANDPFRFRKRGNQDIATVIMNNLRNSEMVQQVSLRGGCFLSFKLSWKWLAKRIDDGIDTWAPVYGLRRAALKYPTGDMDLDKHSDVFRSECISNVLYRMLRYSGVDVITGGEEQQSLSRKIGPYVKSVVEECFLAEQGEFKARGKHGPPLFVGTAGERGYINADIDLSCLWTSIMEDHADLILYITPVRR